MWSYGLLALESKAISALFWAVWSFPWTIRCFCLGWDLSIGVCVSESSLEDVSTLGTNADFPFHLTVEETNVHCNDVDKGRAGKLRSVLTALLSEAYCFTVSHPTLLGMFLNSELTSSFAEPLGLFIHVCLSLHPNLLIMYQVCMYVFSLLFLCEDLE